MSKRLRAVCYPTLALISSAFALAAVVPALAQENPASTVTAAAPDADPQSATPSPPTTPAAIEQLAPGETPVPVAATPPPPAEPQMAVVAPPPSVPVTDPVLVAIRDRLAKQVGSADKADLAALTAFYATRTEGPLWIKGGTFTPAASNAMTALHDADDWGLESKAFAIPDLPASADAQAQADAEIALDVAALKYAHQASGGRVDPSTLSRFNDERGTFADPSKVLAALATSDKPGAVLEGFHPKHVQFQRLHEALLKLRHGAVAQVEAPIVPETKHLALASGPSIKPGAENADVAAIRIYLGLTGAAGREAVYDPALVAAIKSFQAEHGLKATGIITNATRTALNGGADKSTKSEPASNPAQDIERIVLNMERWRWQPADMGAFHIENNVPEYVTRVFKDGKIVHEEKIIVGKSDTPTPVFAANMLFVIFHPEWGVPDSIKMKEIAPYLRRKTQSDDFFGFGGEVSDTRILQRQNLRVSYNGHPVDAAQIDWTHTDVRNYQFIQPAGGQNVLGVVKFRFPNRHDVYMHDTPMRDLFNESKRAFSHGCMRVHNPDRLAEVILEQDRGWTTEKVQSLLAGSSATNEVKLEHPFPVHIMYLTARVDEEGKLHTFTDLYGHDAKLVAALAGRPVKLEDPSVGSGSDSPLASGDGGGASGGGTRKQRLARAKQQSNDPGLGGILGGLFGN